MSLPARQPHPETLIPLLKLAIHWNHTPPTYRRCPRKHRQGGGQIRLIREYGSLSCFLALSPNLFLFLFWNNKNPQLDDCVFLWQMKCPVCTIDSNVANISFYFIYNRTICLGQNSLIATMQVHTDGWSSTVETIFLSFKTNTENNKNRVRENNRTTNFISSITEQYW